MTAFEGGLQNFCVQALMSVPMTILAHNQTQGSTLNEA
jgi:hypothetical protein